MNWRKPTRGNNETPTVNLRKINSNNVLANRLNKTNALDNERANRRKGRASKKVRSKANPVRSKANLVRSKANLVRSKANPVRSKANRGRSKASLTNNSRTIQISVAARLSRGPVGFNSC